MDYGRRHRFHEILRCLQVLLTALLLGDTVSCLSINSHSGVKLTPKAAATQHRTIWDDQGVVSLSSLKVSNNNEVSKVPSLLVAGTKRGQLHTFQFARHDDDDGDDDTRGKDILRNPTYTGELAASENYDNEDSTPAAKSTVPYPVYSLLSWSHPRDGSSSSRRSDGGERHWLFSGSGDRFITVFVGEEQQENGEWKWSVRQRLGPHTGWVKALAMMGTSSSSSSSSFSNSIGSRWLLHSIGCNCIETWEADSNNDGDVGSDDDMSLTIPIWKHKKKRAIESSPDQGATLSSDLLCLAVWKEWLISGGVDGRLHIWSSDPDKPAKPLYSMAAHDGRVSALGVVGPVTASSQEGFLLFSIGHDGQLQCRKCIEDSTSGELKLQDPLSGDRDTLLLGCFKIVDGHENPMRLTALSCDFMKDSTAVQLLLGSASGTLHRICVSTNNDWETCFMQETGPKIVIGAEAIVYSISNYGDLSDNESPHYTQAVVGHSKGLSTVVWA